MGLATAVYNIARDARNARGAMISGGGSGKYLMLERLFPKQIDNRYQGYPFAIWVLASLVLIKFMMGLNVSGLNPWIDNRFIAQSVDRLPLDTYSAETASVVMFLFASWGLALFALTLLGVIVLIRYRAMIPLVYLLLAIEQFGRKAIGTLHPIVRAEQADGLSSAALINWCLMAALAIGFILSLVSPRRHTPANAVVET